jgi:hypothetical protein
LETVESHTNFHLLHIPLLHFFVVKMSNVDEVYRYAEEVLAKADEVLHFCCARCYAGWVILMIFRQWSDLTHPYTRGQYWFKVGELIGHYLILREALADTNDQRAWLNENREQQIPLWQLSFLTLHH